MYKSAVLASLSLLSLVSGQQAGTSTSETHPRLTWQDCSGGSCKNVNGEVVLDSNWRWAHVKDGYTNCYTGSEWNATVCPDNASCAKNCAIDGADYGGTYGISTSGNSLTLKLVQKHEYGTNVGSRVYLMESSSKYKMFNLINKEFTFDVDVSKVPCGVNGALYFVEMTADGGMNKGQNKAGAKYGTGYCDAQCPHDIKWIAGEGNVDGWQPSSDDENAGVGKYGTCCPEMDIWEANSMGAAYTPHPCSTSGGPYRCEGTECGDVGGDRYAGVCDKDGCDYSHYRLGDQAYYGSTVNVQSKFTVVTQFLGSGSNLNEIRRLYKQGGSVIENSVVAVDGVEAYDSITDQMCEDVKVAFGDNNHFKQLGGLNEMGASLARGHVLVMSIWVDFYAHMLWLDSTYPTDADPSKPGAARGACDTSSGDPVDVIANQPDSTVTFSNIKFGAIGSTYK
ncbi:glycoside hydrolase family 7 protein [Patellaria atrata CBS 101060]|uniref:Glucanase n=1 Tax=Patellaria atrata CBS 101060 TaxID=1346257 RepID=A0A9P4VR10_9PEZI|nr:glycoside hydrolase family 7 protein [Patellaria atrata CBS 101060]